MPKQKTTFRVHPHLWAAFMKQTESLFLNRAAFLDNVLQREVRELRAEMQGRVLSVAAKRYISGQLKRQGAKSVSVELRRETVADLDAAVASANLVRDAVFNRILIFLRSSDALLKHLGIPQHSEKVRTAQGMPTSPLKAMENLRDDPLYYIRTSLEEAEDWSGIYSIQIAYDDSFDWAACYIADEAVPGTAEYRIAVADRAKEAAAFEALELSLGDSSPALTSKVERA